MHKHPPPLNELETQVPVITDLVVKVEEIPVVSPKHDMRGIGMGDNGEGDEGNRFQEIRHIPMKDIRLES